MRRGQSAPSKSAPRRSLPSFLTSSHISPSPLTFPFSAFLPDLKNAPHLDPSLPSVLAPPHRPRRSHRRPLPRGPERRLDARRLDPPRILRWPGAAHRQAWPDRHRRTCRPSPQHWRRSPRQHARSHRNPRPAGPERRYYPPRKHHWRRRACRSPRREASDDRRLRNCRRASQLAFKKRFFRY